ncbi:MAG TPA: HlyD family secretion protein [Candidatus Binataceae bacterium]|nr:HlyD family secretion protein [Candidatus Binataceae bacterium]
MDRNGAHEPDSSKSDQESLYEQVSRLWLEVERLRDQQEALQHTPPSAGTETGGTESEESNEPDSRHPAGSRIFRWRPVTWLLALIIAALLCAAAVRFWNYMQSYQWTDDAEINGHLDPISARINGTVVHVFVENTYHVKKGQALVDLDPSVYQIAVEDAAANLAEAVEGVKEAQQNYNFSVANLAAAVATNTKAQEDVKRYGALYRRQVIPRETYDGYLMTGRVDAATVNSDQAAVKAAYQEIGQAQAVVQAAQASLNQAKLNLSYTHIVAPASGVVGDKTVQVGQRVQPGQQLLTVVPLNKIWLTADFRETQLKRMRPGEPVTIHVDATGLDYKGYVEGVPGATGELFSLLPPENATGNYVKVVQRLQVRILLYPGQDSHHRLRPGMSAEATAWLTGHPESLW